MVVAMLDASISTDFLPDDDDDDDDRETSAYIILCISI